jgi:hypothetical protein
MNATQQQEIGEMDGAGLNLEDFLAEAEIDTVTNVMGNQRPEPQSPIPPLAGYTGRFYLDTKRGFAENYEA